MMNSYSISKKENKIFQVSPGCWRFPEQITIMDAEIYHEIESEINLNEKIVFDLTMTDDVSSAFVGFMMDVNKRAESHGGSFIIKSSQSMDRVLSLLELKDFFNYS